MMTQNAPQLDPSLPNQGPGDRLQAARISIGLTLEDVADKMHLSVSILNSLEENNFDDITAPIFVKGYLRSYARIVRLDENEIIEQYNHFYADGDPPIASTSNAAPEINADDARVKWVTRLVVVALVGLLSLWWWNRYQQPAQPLSLESGDQLEQPASEQHNDIRITSAESSDERVATDAALSQDAWQELSGLSSPGSEPEPEPVTETVIEVIEPIVELAAVDSGNEETALPTASEIDRLVEDRSETEPETAIDVVEEAPQVAESESPVATSEDLQIVVNADTWADIRDADGGKLVRDLLRAGRTLSLSGKAPLRVFLGNGYGVSLTYKGEEVDITSHIKPNNTAKFSLGQ